MFFAFFKPASIRFILFNAIRLVTTITILLVIASQIFELQQNLKAFSHRNDVTTVTSTTHSSSSVDRFFPPKLARRAAATPTCGYIAGSSIPTQVGGVAFTSISAMLNILVLAALLIAEIPLPAITGFYDRHLAPLGPKHGIGWSSLVNIYIASNILSASISTFPLVTAFMLFVLGAIGLVLGPLFGRGVREERSLGFGKSPSSKSSIRDIGLPVAHDISLPQPAISRPQPSASVYSQPSMAFAGEKATTYNYPPLYH